MIKFKTFYGYADGDPVDELANEWMKKHPYIQVLDMRYECYGYDNNFKHHTREALCIMYADEYI